jgi:RNA polymerase sigma factor (sigma-70 family)
MVLAAGSDESIAQPALERLCRKYWWPLFGFAQRGGLDKESSEDVVQTYLLSVIARASLSQVERGKGRFRTWLLAGLEHTMRNEWRRDRAKKRGEGVLIFSLDDSMVADPTLTEMSAAEAYDRQWAQTIMLAAMARLREEQGARGKAELYQRLEPIVTGQDRSPYVAIASRMGITEQNLTTQVFRLRGRLREILRHEIAQTVASHTDLEEEMRYLLGLLLDSASPSAKPEQAQG